MRFDANKWRPSFWMSFLICPLTHLSPNYHQCPWEVYQTSLFQPLYQQRVLPKVSTGCPSFHVRGKHQVCLVALEADDKNKSNGLWNSNIFWQLSIENRRRMVIIIGPGPLFPHLRFVYAICLDSSEAWHKFKLFYFNCQAMCFVLIFVMSPDGATSQQ